MNRHEDIYKERFLVWLMFLLPIACTGWVGIAVWTGVQIAILNDQLEKRKELDIPIRERSHIKKMNEPENLTELDKHYLKDPRCIKIKEGVYYYERKKKL